MLKKNTGWCEYYKYCNVLDAGDLKTVYCIIPDVAYMWVLFFLNKTYIYLKHLHGLFWVTVYDSLYIEAVCPRTDKMGQNMFKMFLFHQTTETGWTNSALLQDEPDFRCRVRFLPHCPSCPMLKELSADSLCVSGFVLWYSLFKKINPPAAPTEDFPPTMRRPDRNADGFTQNATCPLGTVQRNI